MNDQLGLFDPPSVPQRTSRAAARAIRPHTTILRARVLDYIEQCMDYGATDEQCQSILNLDAHTQVPRRIELVRAGLIVDSGITRPTRSGRQAIVWRKP
jgi:hypothetical protein